MVEVLPKVVILLDDASHGTQCDRVAYTADLSPVWDGACCNLFVYIA